MIARRRKAAPTRFGSAKSDPAQIALVAAEAGAGPAAASAANSDGRSHASAFADSPPVARSILKKLADGAGHEWSARLRSRIADLVKA